MRAMAMLFYGGPDQLMPLTSGLAAIFAFLLVFWNKVLFVFCKMLDFLRRSKKAAAMGSAESKVAPGDGRVGGRDSELN
jgi:hypothetical protein